MDATIPFQIDQILTLALGVVAVTQGLKAAAAYVDVYVSGKGSVAVSAAVSVLLTLAAYGAGWAPVPSVDCALTDPFACGSSLVAAAGAVLALGNVLYVAVYSRVFGSDD